MKRQSRNGSYATVVMQILVTGPARSGKSEWAEALAAQSQRQLQRSIVYIATAEVDAEDADWQQRIAQHQQRRPASWQTRHVPIELAQAIEQGSANECLLIDSLGTWLANLIGQSEADWQQQVAHLLTSLRQTPSDLIFVAEEVGWGVIPAYASGRRFRDRLGQLTRQIGAIADVVYLVTGGYAIDLSRCGVRLPNLKDG